MKADDLGFEQLVARDAGVLRVRGGRAVLADAAATYRLAEELEETLGRAAARGVLTRFGFQSGFQEATRLRTYYDWDSDLEWLRAGAKLLTEVGTGRVELEEVVVDRARGVFRVVAVVGDSLEAAMAKDRRGTASDPVCDRLVGWLSGFGSAFLGDDVLFIEHECAAAAEQARRCRFEGRLAAEWGEQGQAHQALYRRDAIGERLASQDRELFAQAVKIREQELEIAAKRRVEQASRLKSEFLANISHELRTPLNSIIGYTDLLLTKIGAKLPDTPRRNLERILANAEHLLGLINSILDISKIEAGRMELRPQPTDARAILDRCVEDARVLLKGKPVEVQAVYQGAVLPRVLADGVRLQQCIVNVLGNAAKFTERGHVRVECRTISGRRSGHERGFLAISIGDTGPGIAPEHQSLIFEPFRQVDASTTRAHGGTGLGLAIVRELLGLMGGEIRLQSTPGAGSTFTLIVPLADAAEGAVDASPSLGGHPVGPPRLEQVARAPAPAPAPGSASSEVLLIDDDPDFAAIVTEALAPGGDGLPPGVGIVTEKDPIRGLALARTRPPGAIILDLKLPSFDGREVLRLLREDPRTRDVPVLCVSMRDDLPRTLAEGALAALPKPVAPATLRATVAAALASGPRAGGGP